jgi:phosphate transport system permease protein
MDPTAIVVLGIVLAVVVGGVLLVRSGIIPERVRRRWPFAVSLLLGLIPVVLFGLIVAMLVINSLPALSDPGLPAILGDRYSSKYSGQNLEAYGLLPALSGSLLITIVAVTVTLPVAMALAIVAVDFPMGPLGRFVRPVIGLLSGVPPIVYAASVPIFVTVFMIPKFAADSTFDTFDPASIGADPASWPPPNVPFSPGSFPWDLTGVSNSTLLGGLLVALFLIPFITPLFADAMRDVSTAAREASLALGANRSYTLRKVILPLAMPGIAGALTLGTLKALGDTLIVAFAVGWSADTIPQPLFDVLERTPSLAAQGAGLIGSFETLNATCTPAQCAVGYSSALLLLLFAGVMVLFMTYIQARGRRRVAA